MIKFSRGALNRPRHDTPFCNSLCNGWSVPGADVHVHFCRADQVRVLGEVKILAGSNIVEPQEWALVVKKVRRSSTTSSGTSSAA
jgi:hypothetical protein